MASAILYSFRRCPYAIRARLALRISGTPVQLREVVLRDKPPALLRCSAKATVPVLQLGSGRIIDESLDIMHWALARRDPEDWLLVDSGADRRALMHRLIERNDDDFKPLLDRYKYADRFPQQSAIEHRTEAEVFIAELEALLQQHRYLVSNTPSLADMAILPFVRQFANVESGWFASAPWPAVRAWLEQSLHSDLFNSVMVKYPMWREGDEAIWFN